MCYRGTTLPPYVPFIQSSCWVFLDALGCGQQDPYFPHGNVDLRYAISCDATEDSDKMLKLRTNQKTLILSADSTPSRDEWVKAIRKVRVHHKATLLLFTHLCPIAQ